MLHLDEEFRALLQRVRTGCPDATRRLFEVYQAPILHIVRRKLHPRMRNHYDSQDFLQDVWSSFYAMTPEAWNFETADQLCAFLGDLAAKKVVDRFRQRFTTANQGLDRIRSLDGSAALAANNQSAPDPTPSRVAMAREQLERLLDGQTDDFQRLILLAASGRTSDEIAQELKLPARTVRRLLENFREEQRRSESK